MSQSDDICAALSSAGFNLCPEYVDTARAAGSAQRATEGILNSDLRKKNICAPSFPDDISSSDGVLRAPIVAQISSVCNIGQPSHAQHENSMPCTLLVKLTDGHVKATALCMSPISQLTTSTPPGSKIRIHGGTKYLGGKLLLSASTCTWLGGTVQALIDTWKANRYALNLRKSLTSMSKTGNDPPKFDFHLSGGNRPAHAQAGPPPQQQAPKAPPSSHNVSPKVSGFKKDKDSSRGKTGHAEAPRVIKSDAPPRKGQQPPDTAAPTAAPRPTYPEQKPTESQISRNINNFSSNFAAGTGDESELTFPPRVNEPLPPRQKPNAFKSDSQGEKSKLTRHCRPEHGSEPSVQRFNEFSRTSISSVDGEPAAGSSAGSSPSGMVEPRNIYSMRKPSDGLVSKKNKKDSKLGNNAAAHRTIATALSSQPRDTAVVASCDNATNTRRTPPAIALEAWPELPAAKSSASSDTSTSQRGCQSSHSQVVSASRQRTDSTEAEKGNNLLDYVKMSGNSKTQKKKATGSIRDSRTISNPVNEPWACTACTFVNHPDMSSCEICDRSKN